MCRRAVRVNSQLKSHKRFANAFLTYCQLVDNARLYCTNVLEGPPKVHPSYLLFLCAVTRTLLQSLTSRTWIQTQAYICICKISLNQLRLNNLVLFYLVKAQLSYIFMQPYTFICGLWHLYEGHGIQEYIYTCQQKVFIATFVYSHVILT